MTDREGVRYSLPSCRLPKRHIYIDRQVDEMRRQLEDATVERHGEVTIYHANVINAACDHERARQFLYSRLRACENGEKELKPDQLANILHSIGKAADHRTKCVERLGLDQQVQRKPWEIVQSEVKD